MGVRKGGDKQPFFEGFEPSLPSNNFCQVQGRDAIFFALLPDTAVSFDIHAIGKSLATAYGLIGKPLKPENLHITLHPLGQYDGIPAEILDLAVAVALTIRSAPIEIAFNAVMSFKRPRNLPFVLCGDDGVVGVSALQKQFSERLKPIIKGGQQSTPHMTLLYDDKSIARQSIESVRFSANSFALIHSRVGQGQHEILNRWPLRSN
jgi:2'-5' RNA ligase